MMRRAEYGAVITAVVFVMAMAAAGIWFGLEEVWHRMLTLSPVALAGLLGLSLVNYMLRAWRWYLYSEHLNIHISRRRTGLYYFAGFAMTTTPGKLGEALRLWFLERCHGYRYERTAPLLIGDRMGDAVAITLLCLAGISAFGAAYVTGNPGGRRRLGGGAADAAAASCAAADRPGDLWNGRALAPPVRCRARRRPQDLPAARSQDLRADLCHGRHRLAVRVFGAALVADRPWR